MLEQADISWETADWGEFVTGHVYPENCSPREGPMLEQGRSVRGKQQHSLSTNPILHHPAALRCEEEESGIKEWNQAGEEEWGCALGFDFVSHHFNVF